MIPETPAIIAQYTPVENAGNGNGPKLKMPKNVKITPTIAITTPNKILMAFFILFASPIN